MIEQSPRQAMAGLVIIRKGNPHAKAGQAFQLCGIVGPEIVKNTERIESAGSCSDPLQIQQQGADHLGAKGQGSAGFRQASQEVVESLPSVCPPSLSELSQNALAHSLPVFALPCIPFVVSQQFSGNQSGCKDHH